MIATRARNFPDFPMGYHMGELFRAIGQEPPDAEGVMGIGEMDRTAPPRVWLQVDTNGDPSDRSDPIPRDAWGELTWCYESIGGQEVVYVREDIARRLRPQAEDAMVERAAKAVSVVRQGHARAFRMYLPDARAALTAALTTSPEADK